MSRNLAASTAPDSSIDPDDKWVTVGGRRYKIVHSRLNEPTVEELREIREHLRSDIEERRRVESPGYPDAVRWAIGVAAAHVRALRAKADLAKQLREPAGG